jgi:hypothetical protein
MRAFGLEEAGHYEYAEEAGMTALAANPDDVWAVHAVVHSYEMRGMVDTGIRFLHQREGDWGSGNLFTVHNWWHLALYCLEAGDPGAALAIYDRHVHHGESAGVPIEMLDASALLWRLRLDGVDTGGRFAALGDAWATRMDLDCWYVFNDLHAVVALCGAGRLGDARAVVDRLARSLDTMRGTNVVMTAEVGLPASAAIIAHTEGRYGDVVAGLAPIRRHLHRFGGSHAQRDLLQRTLLDAALAAGELDLARALLAERLDIRRSNVWAHERRARLGRLSDDPAVSSTAQAAASAHRERFTAALQATKQAGWSLLAT